MPLKESALRSPAFLERLAKDREIAACNEEIQRALPPLCPLCGCCGLSAV